MEIFFASRLWLEPCPFVYSDEFVRVFRLTTQSYFIHGLLTPIAVRYDALSGKLLDSWYTTTVTAKPQFCYRSIRAYPNFKPLGSQLFLRIRHNGPPNTGTTSISDPHQNYCKALAKPLDSKLEKSDISLLCTDTPNHSSPWKTLSPRSEAFLYKGSSTSESDSSARQNGNLPRRFGNAAGAGGVRTTP